MKTLIRYGVLFTALITLSACGSTHNASSTTEGVEAIQASGTYYDQFADIPIPVAMSVDRSKSLTATTQDGMRIGLISLSGRVDVNALNTAMIRNMQSSGWSLKGVTTGMKTVQIYEKGNQYTVIYTYEGTFSTLMEIWRTQSMGGAVY